jgi:hypothetical protein
LLMLTLSIAAATLTFSVVNGVLLRELPYPEADRLYYLHWRTQSGALHASAADRVPAAIQPRSSPLWPAIPPPPESTSPRRSAPHTRRRCMYQGISS